MTLAQASSHPPRRELDKEDSSPCAISLRRDPLRLGETSTRSKRVLVACVTTGAESPGAYSPNSGYSSKSTYSSHKAKSKYFQSTNPAT
ncbi:hypothetical protein DEO72_LG11g2392 [Vigna unguiculata]|uniref:Uncharacterized protein n=1 Tax=Vigna unguiculata TaxID=3917 RepID=A0A4D6NR33_VIGUN|nr:hypothetical protein DEO72_LG11g2392 [Vigna unguiculata]